MNLTQLKTNQSGLIKGVILPKTAKERFENLGLVKGRKITLLRKGLFCDPIEVMVDGVCLAFRRSEAKNIIIEVL